MPEKGFRITRHAALVHGQCVWKTPGCAPAHKYARPSAAARVAPERGSDALLMGVFRQQQQGCLEDQHSRPRPEHHFSVHWLEGIPGQHFSCRRHARGTAWTATWGVRCGASGFIVRRCGASGPGRSSTFRLLRAASWHMSAAPPDESKWHPQSKRGPRMGSSRARGGGG